MHDILQPLQPRPRHPRQAGFSLIEILVALSVIGVATTIFMQLFVSSMGLGKLSRDRQVALAIAEEQLTLLSLTPSAYIWEIEGANEAGIFRIRTSADEPRAGLKASLPKAMPPDLNAHKHQTDAYDRFRWKLFGKLGERGLIYEIYADVQWDRPGHGLEHVTLTGAVSRSAVDPNWVGSKP